MKKKQECVGWDSKPTDEILIKAISQVKSNFTKTIMEYGFKPTDINHFGISVINIRGGYEMLIDYTFTKKTGMLVNVITVERRYVAD